MLAWWGIDASEHRPTGLSRDLCVRASAIFVMAPPYLRRLLLEYGTDLASKAYRYADPFTAPDSLDRGQHTVSDPSFDERPVRELVEDFAWMHTRARQIHEALHEGGRPLTAAASYLNIVESVASTGH